MSYDQQDIDIALAALRRRVDELERKAREPLLIRATQQARKQLIEKLEG